MRRISKRGTIDSRSSPQGTMRMFTETVNRVGKGIHKWDTGELFTVEFKGYKFNALPFLLSGAAYFDATCYGWLLKAVAKDCPVMKDFPVQELNKDRLMQCRMFDALLPGVRGRRELYALYFLKKRDRATKLYYNCAIRTLNRIVLAKEFPHITYQYKDICNTQAFCYYMWVYWLVNLTPVLRRQIDSNLKSCDFISIFESLCPEQSLHFKYISGQISMEELIRLYDSDKFEDDSTVAIREGYSNVSKGNYDGSPMSKEQWSIGREEVDSLLSGSDNYLNMHLGHAYLFGGTFANMQSELTSTKDKLKFSQDAEARLKQRYQKSSDECRELRHKNRELKEEVSSLRGEISRHTTDSELSHRISELEADLRAANDENCSLFQELLDAKQELSIRAKQIKKLQAQVSDSGVVIEDVVEDEAEVSVEDMIEALKDKRIVMVGGDRSKSVVKTFEDWGFSYFTNMSGNVRRVDCDFLVICSILCSHKDMYMAEKWVRGQDTVRVYVNNVNAEIILRELYNTLG